VKKLIVMTLAVAMLATLVLGTPVSATGNGAPSGAHYNLNIIGVPKAMNANFDGGNGARIFVSRTGSTQFYVHGGDSYAILDHDGTDGKVGTSITDPGIIFPYDTTTQTWQVDIYVRLVGPKDSSINWTSWYWDGVDTWVLIDSFTLDKSSKFQLRTGSLLMDGYQDILWQLDPVTKFRNLQMRIYLK
jgi:hypothetical protein